jgi:DNA-binding LacI/PurR family transcriptional regulator
MTSMPSLPGLPSPTVGGKPRRVTVKDVALHAGVQHASVCVVLNGAKSNTHVSEAARQRILVAAEELGYKRNGSMTAARTGRFDCAALLLSTDEFRSNLPQRMWDGIQTSWLSIICISRWRASRREADRRGRRAQDAARDGWPMDCW